MKILAATDFSTRSQRALRRAGLLARDRDAELTLLHVVDDDQPPGLAALATREAERHLGEQIDSLAELRGVRCRAVVVAGDPFDGILQTAGSSEAALIVMGAHRRQLLRDIFVGTTVERVIRRGPHPVLMVNGEVERPYATVIAAVDLSEASANAIGTGKALGLTDGVDFALVHGFQAFAKGKMSIAGTERTWIDEYVAGERSRVATELVAFLREHDFLFDRVLLRINEGIPVDAIAAAVQEMHPDLLIIGTRGRSGIAKLLLGSVTEDVLRSVDVDILAVPPAR